MHPHIDRRGTAYIEVTRLCIHVPQTLQICDENLTFLRDFLPFCHCCIGTAERCPPASVPPKQIAMPALQQSGDEMCTPPHVHRSSLHCRSSLRREKQSAGRYVLLRYAPSATPSRSSLSPQAKNASIPTKAKALSVTASPNSSIVPMAKEPA